MKRYLIISIIFFISFICAGPINDSIHLNVQTVDGSGNIITGTFKFEFNISTLRDCAYPIYTNYSMQTTDSRGIISYYLENTNLNYSDQYYLCIYRNGTLQSNETIARTPYAFRARNVTLSGIEADSNLDITNYNITTTGTGFFSWIGDLITRVSKIFTNNIDFNGTINGTGNITTTGRIGIGTEYPSQSLDIRGQGNFSGVIFINNATDISTWIENISRNWTLETYTAYISGTNSTENIQILLIGTNISQYAFNQTLQTFNTYNATWDESYLIVNHTLLIFNEYNSTWDNRWVLQLLSANDTAINNSVIQLYTINSSANIQQLLIGTNISQYAFNQAGVSNTTANIGELYNATASMIANLSISQLGGSGDFSFTDFHDSFVLNASIINNTANIGELYNATALIIAQIVNNSALHIGEQNKTKLHCSNITGSSTDLCNPVGSGDFSFTNFHDSFVLNASIINTTLNIQNLIDNSSIARNGSCSIGYVVQNITSLGVECIEDEATGSGGDFSFTDFHDSFVLNASIINNTANILNLLAGSNISSTNWTQVTMNILTTNFTAINNSVIKLYTINSTANIQILLAGTNISQYALNQTAGLVGINTTRNIQELYNVTASMIANLSISQLGGSGDFSFTDFHDSFVLNSSIINNTANIQELLNSTGIYSIPLTINSTSNIQILLAGTNISQYAFNQAGVGNTTANIGELYNATALIIAQIVNNSALHIGEQNKTKLHCSNITGAAGDLCTVTGSGGDFSFTDFHDSFVLNASIINSTANIGNLYNVTASMIANLSISQSSYYYNHTLSTYNEWGSQWYNHTLATFNEYNSTWDNRWVLQLLSANDTAINNSVIQLYTINSSANIQQLLIGTNISQYAFNQAGVSNTTANIGELYNATASMIANLSISQLGGSGDFSFTDFHDSFVLNSSILNNTKNIQNLYNATASMFNLSQFNLAIAINTTAQQALTINSTANIQILLAGTNISQYGFNQAGVGNTTANIGELYNATALLFAQMVNSTKVHQQLLNGTSMNLASVNSSLFSLGSSNNVSTNSTCVIIKGKTSTLEIC